MASKNTAVFGIFPSDVLAERAVDNLIAAGFSNADISVLLSDFKSTREFAHHKDTKAPEGTAVGVTDPRGQHVRVLTSPDYDVVEAAFIVFGHLL